MTTSDTSRNSVCGPKEINDTGKKHVTDDSKFNWSAYIPLPSSGDSRHAEAHRSKKRRKTVRRNLQLFIFPTATYLFDLDARNPTSEESLKLRRIFQ